jgi:hypothetical protein
MNDETSEQLISGPFPVTLTGRGDPQPGWATVYSGADGSVRLLTQRPRLLEGRRYRYWYEVSTTDHRLSWEDALPSAAAGYSFRARLQATWRVAEPEAIVRRGVRDARAGDEIVRAGLARVLISRCRKFDIEEYAKAEEDLNSRFGGNELPLPEGLTVAAFTARLDLDLEAEQYVRRRRGLDWDAGIAIKEHDAKIGQLKSEGLIRTLTEEQEQALQRARAEALRKAARGDGGLILHVVAQDPSQLRSVLQEVSARQDIEMDLKIKVFHELVVNKLIQPADVDVMWQTFFQKQQPLGLPTSPAPSALGATAPADPPDVILDGSAVEALKEEPGEAGTGTRPDGQPDGVTGWRPVRGRHRPGDAHETRR